MFSVFAKYNPLNGVSNTVRFLYFQNFEFFYLQAFISELSQGYLT